MYFASPSIWSSKNIIPCFLNRDLFNPLPHRDAFSISADPGSTLYAHWKMIIEPWHEISNIVRPAKAQPSLHIRADWSEPLLVTWIFYDCLATDWTLFGVCKIKRLLHKLVWVYICQNATLLEITCHGSYISDSTQMVLTSIFFFLYILKCKRNATVFNPLFLTQGSHESNFLIISCVPAHRFNNLP